LPWAVFDILLSAEDDDDSIYARGDCRLAYNASAVGDSLNYADDEVCPCVASYNLIPCYKVTFTLPFHFRARLNRWSMLATQRHSHNCVLPSFSAPSRSLGRFAWPYIGATVTATLAPMHASRCFMAVVMEVVKNQIKLEVKNKQKNAALRWRGRMVRLCSFYWGKFCLKILSQHMPIMPAATLNNLS